MNDDEIKRRLAGLDLARELPEPETSAADIQRWFHAFRRRYQSPAYRERVYRRLLAEHQAAEARYQKYLEVNNGKESQSNERAEDPAQAAPEGHNGA